MADDTSDKSRGIALALSALLGPFGCHRFYVGKWGTGLLMLGTLGGMGIWYLYDIIMVAGGSFRDADDRRVLNWGERESRPRHHETSRITEELYEEIRLLQSEYSDLAERMDFMERLLTQVRQSDALPPLGASTDPKRGSGPQSA